MHYISADTEYGLQTLSPCVLSTLLCVQPSCVQLWFPGPPAAGSSQRLPQAGQGPEGALPFFLRLSSGRPCLTGRWSLHVGQSRTSAYSLHTLTSPLAHSLALQDPCLHVRTLFLQKLHKGLATYKLPLSYLAILCLYGDEEDKALKAAVSFM